MPYSVQVLVRRDIEFYTLEECKTTIYDKDDEDKLSISFVINEPSKFYSYNLYMIINITNEKLESLQCSRLYKVSSTLGYCDITMKKVYASDNIIDTIEENELKKYKVKLLTVPLVLRKRKWKRTKSSRNLLSNEPVLKKSKNQ
jgi:hypothetical protein